MTRVTHLFDASAGWQQRVAATQLLSRIKHERFEQTVIVLDGVARRALGPLGRSAQWMARRRGLSFLSIPRLARRLFEGETAIVHAWGVSSAVAAAQAAAPSPRPIVLSWFEPAIDERDARWLRTAAEGQKLAIACASATVQRRLAEKGVALESCVVIRPGVDFAVINDAKRSDLRERLGLTPEHRVLITLEPATRVSGAFVVFWTAAIRSFVEPTVRVIVPGSSPQQRRIVRLARQTGFERLLLCPGPDVPFEELLAISDVLVVPTDKEVSTTAIAWAFSASVPVVATAVHATAELVAHKLNGMLFKPAPQTRMAAKVAGLLEDGATLAQTRETARGQAYEVFSVRRYCDQMARLYDNLLAGRAVGDGITDAAAAG